MSKLDRFRTKDHGGNVIDNTLYSDLTVIDRVDNTLRLLRPGIRNHQWVNWLMQGLPMYINFDIRQP